MSANAASTSVIAYCGAYRWWLNSSQGSGRKDLLKQAALAGNSNQLFQVYRRPLIITTSVFRWPRDNIRLSEFMTPPLTTVDKSPSELARIAFRALMENVAQENREDAAEDKRDYPLNTNLVIRRSTALAPVEPARIGDSRRSSDSRAA